MTAPRLKFQIFVVLATWVSIAFLLSGLAIQSADNPELIIIPDDFRDSNVEKTAGIQRSTESSPLKVTATSNPHAARWETHLPKVCSVPAGEGVEEGGMMGYQVLYRMQYFFQTTENPKLDGDSLLCIWIADSADNAIDDFLLQTLVGKCDGFLQVFMMNNETSILHKSDGNHHSIHIPASTEGLRAVFAFVSELKQHTWFHWTDPKSYYFVTENFFYMLHAGTPPGDDKPVIMQSWILENAEVKREYQELFGSDPVKAPGCDTPHAGNQLVVQLLKQCSQLLRGEGFLAIQDWITMCLAEAPVIIICHRPNKLRGRQAIWTHLRRYTEIKLPHLWEEIPTNSTLPTDTISSLVRIHAILHGACDAVWNRVLGALDENGNPGYVHDPYYIKNHPRPLNYHVHGEPKGICEIPFGAGDEGIYGYQGLKKIQIATAHQSKKRVLCMVYTQSNGHFRLQAIAETWGPRCDGFFAASNQTDKSIGAVDLLHEGPEIYENMWMKVRAMFQYAYDHYLNDFELFHIGGDDHYLIPENLRFTAATGSWEGPWDDTTPLLLGGSLALRNRRYCNGGSGYTLNRAALKLLVEKLFEHPRCMPHWQASYEDRLTSDCFRSAGLLCTDTNDDRNETRYHTWNVNQHSAWKIGKPAQDWKKLVQQHGIAWKEGLGQISRSSVSFHLKNPSATSLDRGMRRYHVILYSLCNSTASLDPPEDLIK